AHLPEEQRVGRVRVLEDEAALRARRGMAAAARLRAGGVQRPVEDLIIRRAVKGRAGEIEVRNAGEGRLPAAATDREGDAAEAEKEGRSRSWKHDFCQ